METFKCGTKTAITGSTRRALGRDEPRVEEFLVQMKIDAVTQIKLRIPSNTHLGDISTKHFLASQFVQQALSSAPAK